MMILAPHAGQDVLVLCLDQAEADRIRSIVSNVAAAVALPDVVAVTTKMTVSGLVIDDDLIPDSLTPKPFTAVRVPFGMLPEMESIVDDEDSDARHIDTLCLVVGAGGFWFEEEDFEGENTGVACCPIPLSVLGD